MTTKEKYNMKKSLRIKDLHNLVTDEEDCLCVSPTNLEPITDLADFIATTIYDESTAACVLGGLGYSDDVIRHYWKAISTHKERLEENTKKLQKIYLERKEKLLGMSVRELYDYIEETGAYADEDMDDLVENGGYFKFLLDFSDMDFDISGTDKVECVHDFVAITTNHESWIYQFKDGEFIKQEEDDE